MIPRGRGSGLGRVVLVGAGPGDPDLITVRGARALGDADVVLVDSLVDPRMLCHCRASAEVIDVGKQGFKKGTSQDQINHWLLRQALQGRVVVRLKGGDPFVLGRGGEELSFLAAQNIPCEVIPGLSSALSLATLAHIPLTHRGICHQFSVLSGMSAGPRAELEACWARAAAAGGTLVFLMAMHCLERLALVLMSAGLDASTPCAIIHRGATADERRVTATVGDVTEAARESGLGAPSVIIVGEVVHALGAGAAPAVPSAVEAAA